MRCLQDEMARLQREIAAERVENSAIMAGKLLSCNDACARSALSAHTMALSAVMRDKSARADTYLGAEAEMQAHIGAVERQMAVTKVECEERIRCAVTSSGLAR